MSENSLLGNSKSLEQLRKTGRLHDTDLVNIRILEEVLKKVPLKMALNYQILPIGFDLNIDGSPERLVLVTDNVDNIQNVSSLEKEIKMPVRLKLTTENVEIAIKRHYPTDGQEGNWLRTKAAYDNSEAEIDEITDESHPLVIKVNKILQKAIESRATDVHIDPLDRGSLVKFKIDGKLEEYSAEFPIDEDEKRSIVNRIKIICVPPMEPGNKIMPQDGALQIKRDIGDWVDCRVATLPTIRGERIEIRLHDPDQSLKTLESLGFKNAQLYQLKRLFKRPRGLILVSGPVNSGKSTTLYAGLLTFNRIKYNVCTIEDPVEIKVEGINQVQVRRADDGKNELDFLVALIAFLRHDPNIILVGEIRDKETGNIAVEAGLTGHRVFSTVHTRDALSVIPRLSKMGVDKDLLLGEINCVINQRLFTPNCKACSEPYEPSEDALMLLNQEELEKIRGKTKRGTGRTQNGDICPVCNGRGYVGRTVIAEILEFDNEVRQHFYEDHGIMDRLKFLKDKKNYRTLWELGLEEVANGTITLEELVECIDADR